MNKIAILSLLFIMLLPVSIMKAQNCDIMYFCVRYDPDTGEIDCSDRFTVGNITVVVLLATPVYFEKVFIQLDKFNPRVNDFEYYKDYEFDVEPDMDYIYFNDINFADLGMYRVFLLDPFKETITSALVEIVSE
ncbi:MAG: hypothetical protein JXB60_08615 [Candidatus Cloacimonetes bacterium]|nr:hypothetical protein [Candidatus Cloacimonadota bacterium]